MEDLAAAGGFSLIFSRLLFLEDGVYFFVELICDL